MDCEFDDMIRRLGVAARVGNMGDSSKLGTSKIPSPILKNRITNSLLLEAFNVHILGRRLGVTRIVMIPVYSLLRAMRSEISTLPGQFPSIQASGTFL
jgi:hypothetical protein